MRRVLALFCLLATPAGAWEFRVDPVCTLSHEMTAGSVTVTYDPRLPVPYAISVTRAEPWPEGAVFGIAFGGVRDLTISTTRHVRGDGGRTLTVTDRGFGNVLDGLEFSARAVAFVGDATLSVPLAGAAPEVAAFRACIVGGAV